MDQVLVRSDTSKQSRPRTAFDEEIDRRKKEMQENKGEE
jgi:hypothetical protein